MEPEISKKVEPEEATRGEKDQVVTELQKEFLVQLTYDLLQIPDYIEEKERQITPTKTPKTKPPKPSPKQKKPKIVDVYLSRNQAANPAPHSKDFEPDWIDEKTGVEYGLATNSPIVDQKKLYDRTAIVFWIRVRGTNKGEQKRFPKTHDIVQLKDVRTGQVSGFGTFFLQLHTHLCRLCFGMFFHKKEGHGCSCFDTCLLEKYSAIL